MFKLHLTCYIERTVRQQDGGNEVFIEIQIEDVRFNKTLFGFSNMLQ